MTARARDGMRVVFEDRAEAGGTLAAKLSSLVTMPAVVTAIPRGGVAVALPIAERLGAPLTVVYARKLTAPFAPELAFGALDEDGEAVVDHATVALLGLGPDDVHEAKGRVAAEIRRRMRLYGAPPLASFLPGRAVVLVDDGLATGLTMRAAMAYARRHGAAEVTVAVPCASAQAAERFGCEADRFVSLVVDEDFVAVGAYYADFSPVGDDEVVAMLARARAEGTGAGGAARRLTFASPAGPRLEGGLLLPAGAGPHPVVVFVHGTGSGKDSPRDRVVARGLRDAGIAALLFDLTGHGESGGTRAESTPARQVDDLGAALDAARAEGGLDAGRIGVAGVASGAAVALFRAATDARIRALALRSAPLEGMEDVAPRVRVPVLLVVGGEDEEALEANEALLPRLGGPSRLEVVPGADRLFRDPAALRRAAALTAAWFQEHL